MAKKNKTHSGAKKRFKITSKGKVKRSHSDHSHLLSKKSSKRKRNLHKATLIKGKYKKRVKRLLGK
ncbi:MAG: 50S ribosomal protein L35 [Elusimicrobiota bacterium]